MIKHASFFSQLIALIDRKKILELVYKHQSERFAKKNQFMGAFCSHVVLSGRPSQELKRNLRLTCLLHGQNEAPGHEKSSE